MTRPKTVWLLLVFFAASLARSILLLIQNQASAEARLFQAAGIEWVFFVLVVASVLLDAGASRYLWAPAPQGLRVALASVAVGAAFALLTALVAASDPETFGAVVAAKRDASGQSTDPAAIAFASSPRGISIAVAMAATKAAILAGLLWWNRGYFHSRPATPNPA